MEVCVWYRHQKQKMSLHSFFLEKKSTEETVLSWSVLWKLRKLPVSTQQVPAEWWALGKSMLTRRYSLSAGGTQLKLYDQLCQMLHFGLKGFRQRLFQNPLLKQRTALLLWTFSALHSKMEWKSKWEEENRCWHSVSVMMMLQLRFHKTPFLICKL